MKSTYWIIKNALKQNGYILEKIYEYKGTRNGRKPRYNVLSESTHEPTYRQITLLNLYDRLVIDGFIPYVPDNYDNYDN